MYNYALANILKFQFKHGNIYNKF